jgi:hypothetical protein
MMPGGHNLIHCVPRPAKVGVILNQLIRYVFVEYAKASPEDILVEITVCNRARPDWAASTSAYCRRWLSVFSTTCPMVD